MFLRRRMVGEGDVAVRYLVYVAGTYRVSVALNGRGIKVSRQVRSLCAVLYASGAQDSPFQFVARCLLRAVWDMSSGEAR